MISLYWMRAQVAINLFYWCPIIRWVTVTLLNRKCPDYVYVKMRVLKYYVENRALFETWKYGKRNKSVIILWGIKMWNNHKNEMIGCQCSRSSNAYYASMLHALWKYFFFQNKSAQAYIPQQISELKAHQKLVTLDLSSYFTSNVYRNRPSDILSDTTLCIQRFYFNKAWSIQDVLSCI